MLVEDTANNATAMLKLPKSKARTVGVSNCTPAMVRHMCLQYGDQC